MRPAVPGWRKAPGQPFGGFPDRRPAARVASLPESPTGGPYFRGEWTMGARRIRREQRRFDQNLSRRVNGMKKDDERERRAIRMKELIKKGQFPYTPAIRSWLSAELDMPSSRIQEADVQKVLDAK